MLPVKPLQLYLDCCTNARERFFLSTLFAECSTILQIPTRIAISAWTGHLPFAFWLVKVAQPGLIVELGAHYGVSFCGFCQQAARNSLECTCYAVDTWVGDAQAGFYGEEVFNDLSSFISSNYSDHAHLIRSTFDKAQPLFDDESIDILHIDGYHTREVILHDFETWLPKISRRGVVLFHDINARIPGYSGFDAWQELASRYPHFEFSHSYGLGVLLVGDQPPVLLRELARLGDEASRVVQTFFSSAGKYCLEVFRRQSACGIATDHAAEVENELARISAEYNVKKIEAQDLSAKLAQQAQENADKSSTIQSLRDALAQSSGQIDRVSNELNNKILELEVSNSNLQNLNASLDERNSQIASLESNISQLREELRLSHEARELQVKSLAEDKDSQIGSLQAAIFRLESELQGFKNSRSWRFTAPLRKLKSFFLE